MKKITLTTIKSFIKKNSELYIKNLSNFDGMVDCVMPSQETGFRKAERKEWCSDNTLGIIRAWFVRNSRVSFEVYEDDYCKGYKVYNCCGSFILATKKA
jgi:hypothetical protein